MRSLVRAAAMTGVAGALMLLTAPTSHAGPSAASECITVSESEKWGRGEISLCPQSDGTTRVTGYVEDLLPGGFLDGYCVGWYFYLGEDEGDFGPMVCPHFSPSQPAKKTFDYEFTPSAPVTGANLNRWGI
ncbi:hypothetical protein GCM10027074_37240 [Streptomyces deserti]